jgi:uncharacterized protein (TIGR02996 family)
MTMTEERAFLKAILERPDDDARKLVYADWLEERGDPRAEYLRLMLKVRQERIVTPEQRRLHQRLSAELAELRAQEAEAWRTGQGSSPENRERIRRAQAVAGRLAELSGQIRQRVPARLPELAAVLDPGCLAVVSDPAIEGCGRSTGGMWWPWPRFDFVCDKSWADMGPTGDTGVRHCEACGKDVYFCDNLADAREHAEASHCIAVDLGDIRREGDLIPPFAFAGRPSKEDIRQSYEHGVDPVSQARLDARKKPPKKGRRRR